MTALKEHKKLLSVPSSAVDGHLVFARKRADAQRQVVEAVGNHRKSHLKLLLAELIEFKKEKAIDDDDFAEVMELVLEQYVESEVSQRLNELIYPLVKSFRLSVK